MPVEPRSISRPLRCMPEFAVRTAPLLFFPVAARVLWLAILFGTATAQTTNNGRTPTSSTAAETPQSPSTSTAVQGTASSITKDGVTWTFSRPVPVGQFVTGDYLRDWTGHDHGVSILCQTASRSLSEWIGD